ncbi:hypothetical protein [Microbulbifer epialgicus]|uniref:Uncharacterized protein n=1 Tax=Microbulbifer epialgicus TaxID=393907 RepID=A0ABV4P2V2_9GAMM
MFQYRYAVRTIFFLLFNLMLAGSAHASISLVWVARSEPETNDFPVDDLPKEWQAWCGSQECDAVAKLQLRSAVTERVIGEVYSWSKSLRIGTQSLCFDEFLIFRFSLGDLYTVSNEQGACGGFMDADLYPPLNDNGLVLGGGSDGSIVGGTGFFGLAEGNYTSRLFLEYIEQDPAFYNELLFRVSIY